MCRYEDPDYPLQLEGRRVEGRVTGRLLERDPDDPPKQILEPDGYIRTSSSVVRSGKAIGATRWVRLTLHLRKAANLISLLSAFGPCRKQRRTGANVLPTLHRQLFRWIFAWNWSPRQCLTRHSIMGDFVTVHSDATVLKEQLPLEVAKSKSILFHLFQWVSHHQK